MELLFRKTCEAMKSANWWRKRAQRLAWRVNAGWWLDVWLPAALVISALTAAGVLVLRRLGHDTWWVVSLYAAALVIGGGLAWWRSRGKFYTERDGLVRLEERHRLHNRLSSAADGVGDWPLPVAQVDDGLGWHWPRFLSPPLLSVLLVAAAWLIPMQVITAMSKAPVDEPVAWRQVDDWLQTIEEEGVTEEESLQKLQEQLDELRAQPKKEWYRHSSMEAGDSLREQTQHQLREFQRNLESAMAAVSVMEKLSENVPESMQERWRKHMRDTLDGLQSGGLKLDQEWLDKLQSLDIDPSKLRQLTEEEMKQLKQALKKGLKSCQQCTGKGTNDVVALVQAMCMAGNAGISRGPGTMPLTLKENETQLGTTASEMIQNDDLRRASIGDTLAVREKEHEIDETKYQGPVAAGAVASAGEGGETVWKQNLMPDERDVLKEYFK